MKMLVAWLAAALAAAAGGGTIASTGYLLIGAVAHPETFSLTTLVLGAVLVLPLFSAFFGFIPAVLAMAFLGTPAHIILTNAGTTRPRDYARAGLCIGLICAIPPALVALTIHDNDGSQAFAWVMAAAVLTGGPIGGYLFGTILWEPKRPRPGRAATAQP